jgi:thiol-activated cytolysin
MANHDIDYFIRHLDYDPKEILAVKLDGDVTTKPITNAQTGNHEVVVCTTTQHTLTKNLSEVAILSTGAVAFPGALLMADERLKSGGPTPIGLPRAKLMLTVLLPGSPNPSGLVDPTTSGVQSFLNEKLEEWNKFTESNENHQNYGNAANTFVNYSTAYTKQQVAASLGFRAEWARGAASTQLDVSSTTERSVVFCYYKQVFYTVKINPPGAPSDVFDPSVSLVDLRDIISDSAPPAYVDSVDYGRILLVRMETSAVDTSVNLHAAFKQATQGGVTASGDLQAKYDDIIKNASFTAVAIGGGTAVTAPIFNGAVAGELQGLKEYFNAGRYSRENPGLPIAYVVRFLKDNVFATIGATTDFTETECTRYKNISIQIVHHGGYIAKFYWSWSDMDALGNYTPGGGGESGPVTAGWTTTVWIPGTARDVELRGEADTGIVWNRWQEIGDIRNPEPNKTYTAVGTTLIGRQFEVSG